MEGWAGANECGLRLQVMRRYHIQDRDDYKKYNKICGMITKLTNVLKHLDAKDSTRIELTDSLLEKWVHALWPAPMHGCVSLCGTALCREK